MIWNNLELPKPYYQDDAVYIIHGDCREVLPLISDKSIDLIPTSPPYNVGIDYGANSNDKLPLEDYLKFTNNWIKLCGAVLKTDGRFACVVPGGTSRDPYIAVGYEVLNICKDIFQLRGTVIWYKGIMHGKTTWGSWCSPSDPNLRDFSELIVIAHNKDARKAFDGKTDLTPEEFMLSTTDLWFIPPVNRENGHPAPFPEIIPARLMRLYTYLNDIILDPFLGSGTTAYCAKKLNRKCIGIEIEEKYCHIAAERCRQTVMNLGI